MARARRSSPSEDEDDLDEDEEPEPRRPRRVRRRRPSSARPPAPRRWKGPGEDEDEEDDDVDGPDDEDTYPVDQPPIYWRARDSLYFEPLVALAIIVVLLAGLYAYTGNWPPVYVVESDSMQHGPDDQLGLINTGDLVLAQKTTLTAIVPYVVGMKTGYTTYGEYGDVLLYHPNGQTSATPIIHRAILYLDWDPTTLSYSAPELSGLPCGTAPNAVYSTPGTAQSCGTTDLTQTLDLIDIGWQSVNLSIALTPSVLGGHAGFLTLGDGNRITDQTAGFSELVEPGWVVGVARGMIPWFGSLKLLLEGDAGEVPSASWQFMGLTIAGVILLSFGIHYALRVEGIETPLRRDEEQEAEREAEEAAVAAAVRRRRARRWLEALRPWSHDDDRDDEEEEAPPHRRPRRTPTRARPDSGRRGRPRPHVRRGEKAAARRRSSDDDDL